MLIWLVLVTLCALGMAVGTVPQNAFEKEDVNGWSFVCNDARITDITGWTITLVIKLLPTSTGAALLGPFTASITSSQTFEFDFNVDLAPGTYTYSVRKTNPGEVAQLAQGTFTVAASAHVTH